MQYPGITAAESLAGEKLKGGGYSAFVPAIEAAYSVGSTVVNKLVDDWSVYESSIPGN
jgi:purine nucleoside permease